MTRRFTAYLAVFALIALVIFDYAAHEPNPYKAPHAFALGSGVASSGGFCGVLPK